jgi:hypothetical protein
LCADLGWVPKGDSLTGIPSRRKIRANAQIGTAQIGTDALLQLAPALSSQDQSQGESPELKEKASAIARPIAGLIQSLPGNLSVPRQIFTV